MRLAARSQATKDRFSPRQDILVVGGALLALSPWLVRIEFATMQMLLVANIVVTALTFSHAIRANHFRPVTLVWALFSCLWLVVGATYQLNAQEFAWGDVALLAEPAHLTSALFLLLAANVSFFVGNSFGKSQGRDLSGTRSVSAVPRRRFAWIYAIACLALSPFAISANGGIANLFSSRSDRFAARSETGFTLADSGGVAVALVGLLPAALALAALTLFIVSWRAGEKSIYGVGLASALLILWTNPLSNTRFLSAAAIGSIVILLLRPRSRAAGFRVATICIVGVLFVYPLANGFKNTFSEQTAIVDFSNLSSQDFDGYQQIASTFIFVEDQGHQLGRYVASAALYFVPRSLWEAKATPASIDVAEYRGYVFTDLGLPLAAEFYLDFGWLGVVLLVGLYGRLVRWLDDHWVQKPDSVIAMIVPYVMMSQFAVMRGPLGSLLPVYGSVVALLAIAMRDRNLTLRQAHPKESHSLATKPSVQKASLNLEVPQDQRN